MKGFLDLPYRLPFARHYKTFDRGFYVDFPKQLGLMGRWLKEFKCRKTLDIGAMTGGCIEYISGLGIRMDGVQFTPDLKKLADAQLKDRGVKSTLHVSPVHAPLRLPAGSHYDGIVSLGWFNLPLSPAFMKRYLKKIHDLLTPGGVFLFDFFEFEDLVVAPTEALKLAADLTYVSHSEVRGNVLRRYHLWAMGDEVFSECSDLVDRGVDVARKLLEQAGLKVVKTEFLDLHYPRHFWAAQRV